MKKVGFLVLYFVSILSVVWFNTSHNANAEEGVSVDLAKKAALNHLEQSVYSEEIDSVDDLILKTYLYDVDESLLGYYFTYENNHNYYYILVSATTDRAPILQHGEGLLDYENDNELKEGKKLYYLGPLQFLYGENKDEITLKFKEKKRKMLKDFEEQKTTSSLSYDELNKKEIPRVNRSTQHVEEWNKLLAYEPSTQYTARATTYRLLGVTRLWQRSSGVNNPNSACGPTTAAMISNYLKGQGFSVKGTSSYSSTGAFINHMYNDLGTTSTGTSISKYISGLNTHLEHNYTSNKWDTWNYRAYGYYSHFKDSINNNKPVGLRFDFWVSEGTYIDYHFVAGIGYNHGSVAEFAIKDPDGGPNKTGTIWLNWNDNNNDMAMGLVNNNY